MSLLLVIALILLAMASLWLIRWFARHPPSALRKKLKWIGIWTGGVLLIGLTLSGRLPWIFALLGGALPMLERMMTARQIYQYWQRWRVRNQSTHASPDPANPKQSEVKTATLHMRLDHQTGQLDGTVLAGPYQGRTLSSMSLSELQKYFNFCDVSDHSAIALLESYLDHRFAEKWRGAQQTQHQNAVTSTMNLQEAFDILGIPRDAKREDVIAAHRKLMQKLHPDRGGSAALAAQINCAKDIILEHMTHTA